MRNVIGTMILGLILMLSAAQRASAEGPFQKRVDSLFLIATSGEVMFKDLVQPAIDSLAAMGVDAVPPLVDKLDTKSARERVTLMQIFKKIGSPAVPHLVAALRVGDGLAVERACMALGEIADSAAAVPLAAIAGHKRWQVREQALGALGRVKSSRGADAVIAGITDTIGLVRKSAAVACGQLRLGTAIGPLVHMLGDVFYGARMCAATALSTLDTPSVVTALLDSLHSVNPLVGNLGCGLLAGAPSEPIRETLLLETQSADPSRRAHAALALIAADPDDQCGFRETYFLLESDPLVRLKIESALKSTSHERP
jgi:HEAT repeat protein